MKYVIVIPSIYPPYTETCMNTLTPETRQHVLLLDNTTDNRGVAASWNLGIDRMVEEDADYLIIVSAAMRFHDGLRDFITRLDRDRPMGLETQFGWHCIALSNETIARTGYFDEQFYPAYYEDSDYIRRMELAGLHEPCGSVRFPRAIIDADLERTAHGLQLGGVKLDYQANLNRFIAKWGEEPYYTSQADRDRLYRHPYGDPNLAWDVTARGMVSPE